MIGKSHSPLRLLVVVVTAAVAAEVEDEAALDPAAAAAVVVIAGDSPLGQSSGVGDLKLVVVEDADSALPMCIEDV